MVSHTLIKISQWNCKSTQTWWLFMCAQHIIKYTWKKKKKQLKMYVHCACCAHIQSLFWYLFDCTHFVDVVVVVSFYFPSILYWHLVRLIYIRMRTKTKKRKRKTRTSERIINKNKKYYWHGMHNACRYR